MTNPIRTESIKLHMTKLGVERVCGSVLSLSELNAADVTWLAGTEFLLQFPTRRDKQIIQEELEAEGLDKNLDFIFMRTEKAAPL